MTGISSANLFCTRCWEGDKGATHFGFKFLLNMDSCQAKLVFLYPIIVAKRIGLRLDFVGIVLVNVETKHVEMLTTSSLCPISLLI